MSGFLVSILGQIEGADFPDFNNIYCKHSYVYGSDWDVTAGTEEGISQIAKKSEDERQVFIWNFPLEISFKSTNPYGWPQLVISVYGLDFFGNDVVRGYGLCHIPITAGHWNKSIPLFVPECSSTIQKIMTILTGRRPEYIDPKLLAHGEGREVTRVQSQGKAFVHFDVMTKDMKTHGLDSSHHPVLKYDSLSDSLANLNI